MAQSAQAPSRATVSLVGLMAMVVGSMIGAGVFSLPQRFASSTGIAGALATWAVAGAGTLAIALVFQRLSTRRPDLDAGIYTYARTGFGEYVGFLSAAGYWASSCIGNVTYWVLIMSTLGQWIPALGAGDTPLAIACSSVGLWLFFLLVRAGATQAAAVNRIVTVAKIIPIVVFLAVAAAALDPAVLAENWRSGPEAGTFFEQLRGTMLLTVFVFLGIEGASVFSRHARRRSDVGRATVLGFLTVLSLFAAVTVVSYGVLPREEIARLQEPSIAGVMEAVVGPWGAVFIAAGLIIAVLGAYLSWTLMAAEVMFAAANDGVMPRVLGRENRRGAPGNALLMSTLLAQVVLILTVFAEDAFAFALDMTAVMALFPFLLTALFLLRISGVRPRAAHRGDAAIALAASAYAMLLLASAGVELALLASLFAAPMTLLYVWTRRQRGRRPFRTGEVALFAGIALTAVVVVWALATGRLAI
ncbi:basic amino acid/polyamine antiporter [Microbacterium sp. gxy059]|uniref:basic amino acid/polyamine antiporter n=1 Tax=Microbacterium sp. gxy059 TaxID=2957199 RepID=UPI003D984C4D